MDLKKYQKIFTQESEKYLKELDDLLIRVEKDLLNCDLWSEIHGKIHSIKGMASGLSLDEIARLCHNMEDWCKQFQEGGIEASPSAVQLLFHGGELLNLLVARMGDISSFEDSRRYNTLVSLFQKGSEAFATQSLSEKLLSTFPDSSTGVIDYVRVKYSLIEELLGLSQEILLLEKTLPPLSHEQISGGLKNWIDDYTSMLRGLHFRLAQLRLMAVGDFADLYIKTIRNLAKENDKQVKFEVIGGEVQADITLLERLREPLIHIFRNSIAHGIEPSDERIKMGKNAEGKIILEATRERDSLFIKISDDGRGINRPAIIKYLKNKKAMADEQVSGMSQEEFFDSILNPDFSSATETTDMAGRGIGMHVVAQAIEYLGGTMTIRSEPSRGTELMIKLPVTLSVMHAVIFRVGEYTLSIPTSSVTSIDRKKHIPPYKSGSFYDLRVIFGLKKSLGKSLNLLELQRPGRKYSQNEEEGEMIMIVDSIIGNRPIMVMPVGELLGKTKIFAGVGIMENGDISILLDIETLIEF